MALNGDSILPFDQTLALVLSADFEGLATRIGARGTDDGLWRLLAIDDADDAESMVELVSSALRRDPDGLMLGVSRPFADSLPTLLARAVMTGHSIFVRGTETAVLEALELRLAVEGLKSENGREFLARLPMTVLQVELSYVSIDQAPRPADLEDGFDCYETTTSAMPEHANPPVEPGSVLRLKVEAPPRYEWEAEGTVAVTAFDEATAIVRGVLPAEALSLISATTARVYAVSRCVSDDDQRPAHCFFRLYLDVPAWVGALVPADGKAYRQLTAVGRRPLVAFRV
jgi:hypothetical protein